MKQNEFTVLSLREEKKLPRHELEAYYAELREYVLKRKLQTTTMGAITVAPKLKKMVNKLDGIVTNLLAGGRMEQITDGIEHIPDGPVLFANTHQGVLDNSCWIPTNPRHALILHTADASKLLVFLQLCTGLVLVDKNNPDNKKNRTDAKLDMIHILLKGNAIWYFPEGTWNLSPNKLHLPMSFGFLEVAKKSGAPVVPVVTEFTYDTSSDKFRPIKMHIRYGKPIYVGLDDDLAEKLEEYSAAVSTIRWELIEEKGQFERGKLTNWDYINYLKGIFHTLELKDSKRTAEEMNAVERRNIRGAADDFYLFHHINDVPFNANGELLETEETIRLEKLFREHFKYIPQEKLSMSINDTIARINELAHKAKTVGLTPEETAERDKLRRIYIDSVKANLIGQLDNTYYLDAKGNKVPLSKKGK